MEALEIITQMVEDGQISQEVAEKYCPEIKKYKDEIVKKQILELIRQHSVNSDRCMMENWVLQHGWKPSKEQMDVLNEVLNFAANHESSHWNDYIFGTLNNLIRQLKKLTE